ncbi:MAG: hypothetical protein ACL93V_08955 [Candidatus Electrothrix sp. YB6]
MLKDGNARFVSGKSAHPHTDAAGLAVLNIKELFSNSPASGGV